MRKIRVGSRESKLAVIQAQIIIDCIKKNHPELELELITMKTTGDKILDKTLDKIGGKGLFVKELDKALLNKEIDIAVHSLKDMPMEVNEKLPILAYSKREDPRDVLILPKNADHMDKTLPIGCSSLRRTLQVKDLYPNIQVKPVRGNVLTRLDKLDAGEFSALILAAAGIKRLNLSERISKNFTVEEMLPAAGQGILAIQGRVGEDYSFLSCVNVKESEWVANCERAFIRELNGGCTSPIAAFATIHGDKISLNCMYEDGRKAVFQDEIEQAKDLGIFAARQKKKGKVWLVGAGPSDPELLTLKAKRVLEGADVVLYDRLVGEGILSMMPEQSHKIYVGKQAGDHVVAQERINEILLEQALQGKKVVRLKGGDPFVFGRGGEELELLVKNDIPFEIVPGITSAVAVPAYQGIPVTYRDYCSSVHLITGHKKMDECLDIDFEALVRTKGTLVFLMGVSSLKDISEGLIKGGMRKDMPAAILENGTKAHQRKVISTIEFLYEKAIQSSVQSPSIIVVGQVCELADKFAWYEKRPLAGCKVVVTRPKELASKLTWMLRERGAEVVELPSMITKKLEDNKILQNYLERIKEFQWVVLTSPTGARVFFEELAALNMDTRKLSHIQFAVIGKATGKVLEERGIFPDLMPDIYSGKELGRLLAKKRKDEDTILILRAKEGAKEILSELSNGKGTVHDIPTYETIFQEPLIDIAKEFETKQMDYAIFTSASTVEGFVRANKGMDYKRVRAICIGEKTRESAQNYHMETYVAKEATMESLLKCLEEAYKRQQGGYNSVN